MGSTSKKFYSLGSCFMVSKPKAYNLLWSSSGLPTVVPASYSNSDLPKAIPAFLRWSGHPRRFPMLLLAFRCCYWCSATLILFRFAPYTLADVSVQSTFRSFPMLIRSFRRWPVIQPVYNHRGVLVDFTAGRPSLLRPFTSSISSSAFSFPIFFLIFSFSFFCFNPSQNIVFIFSFILSSAAYYINFLKAFFFFPQYTHCNPKERIKGKAI